MIETLDGHVYITWEEAFTGLAKLAALKSKVSNDQRGCIIVDEGNRIMSLGFNGVPAGCNDKYFLATPERRKYCVIEAAIGAILAGRRNLEDCSIYMTHYPNPEETKFIIQAGINKVFYINCDKSKDEYISSTKMLEETSKYVKQVNDVKLDCNSNKSSRINEMFNKIIKLFKISNKDYIESNATLTWDDFYVSAGKLLSMRSKDRNTQVGCSISDLKHHIISLGYNGLPFGCKDENCPWDCQKADLDSKTKYPYSVHSESNGVIIPQNNNRELDGCSIYVTLFPCHDCTMKIIDSGIKKVYYTCDKYRTDINVILAKKMLKSAHIKFKQISDVEITLESGGRVLKTKVDASISQEMIYKLEKDPAYIKKIPSCMQTEKMALDAIKKDIKLFKHVKVKTPKVCLEVLCKDGDAIRYIEEPTKEMCKVALLNTPTSIQYIKNPTEEMCKIALERNGSYLQYITNQTPMLCKIAVSSSPISLQYVKNQTNDLSLMAVNKDGSTLQYVKEQTKEIVLAAVSQDGLALRFAKIMDDEICMRAVEEDGNALQYVKKQTEEMCMISVLNNPDAIRYVINQTPYLCLLAVIKKGLSLEYIKKQTKEICVEAIKQNPSALMYVQNKLPEYKVLAVKVCFERLKLNNNYVNEISDKVLRDVILKLMIKKGIRK